MKRTKKINNAVPNHLVKLVEDWANARGDKKQNMLAGGLILYMTVDNVLRSAAVAVADQLDTKELTVDELFDAILNARDEHQRRQDRAAMLSPPKSAGRQKTAG